MGITSVEEKCSLPLIEGKNTHTTKGNLAKSITITLQWINAFVGDCYIFLRLWGSGARIPWRHLW